MEQSTVGISQERNKKLSVIATKTGHDKSELVGDFVDALYSLIVDGLKETERVSLTTWEINLSNSTIRVNAEPLFNLADLPSGLQRDVLASFGYNDRFQDVPRKEQEPHPPLAEQPRKLSHTEQIEKQYEKEKDKE